MSSGRPPSTTHDRIGEVALELFERDGFERTTVEAIAAAVGVSRRTIFHYFPSKNDMVWGNFEWVLARLRLHLEESGPEIGLFDAVRRAAVLSNRYPEEQLPDLRIRMTLITTVPALQAHSMLRYAAWRGVIAEYAARRLDCPAEAIEPQTIAHAALAASMSAFSRWVEHPDERLEDLLEAAYRLLGDGFAALERR